MFDECLLQAVTQRNEQGENSLISWKPLFVLGLALMSWTESSRFLGQEVIDIFKRKHESFVAKRLLQTQIWMSRFFSKHATTFEHRVNLTTSTVLPFCPLPT